MKRPSKKPPVHSWFGLHPAVLIILICGVLVFSVVLTSQAYEVRIRWQNGELEMKPASHSAPVTTTTATKQ